MKMRKKGCLKNGKARHTATILIFGCLLFLVASGFAGCVSPAQAAQRMAVKVSLANVRGGRSTKASILFRVPKYYPFKILRKAGNWYRVEDFENDRGWVYASLLGKIWAVVTKVKTGNIRSGPGLKYRIVFTAEKGVPFRVLKKKGSWLKIKHVDGDSGWIHRKIVW